MKEIRIPDSAGSVNYVARPLENQLRSLQEFGFPVANIEVQQRDEGESVVVFESRDKKLVRALEGAANEAQLLANLKLAEKLCQGLGEPIMIRVGRNSVPMPEISFEEIEQRVEDLIEERLRNELGKNRRLASIFSRARDLIGR